MADATTTTTPASYGRAYVSSKGTVDTGGRRAWVWCQDADTGHRYDVLASRLPRKGLTPVEGYPLNFKQTAREAKTRQQWTAEVAEAAAPEPTGTGDEVFAAVADPVAEAPAPETQPVGDDQTDGQPADGKTTVKGRRA